MLIITDIDNIEIEDIYVSYSPYMSASVSFTKSNIIEVREHPIDTIKNYVNFLEGKSFTMTEEDESFFEFMGHPNENRYPLDFWRLKLRSRWIRDNFYKYKLYDRDNGLYGLIEVPIINRLSTNSEDNRTSASSRYGFTRSKAGISRCIFINKNRIDIDSLDTERDGVVIAGGAALYSAGLSRCMGDVDMFYIGNTVPNIHDSNDEESRRTSHLFNSKNSYNMYYSLESTNSISGVVTPYGSMKVSIISRLYKCPSQVVHGFDLDCCQYIIVYRKGIPTLYATEIAIYSTENDVQWYDPNMTSTTYTQRLCKYHSRGFKLKLPMIEKSDVLTHIKGIRIDRYMAYAEMGYGINKYIRESLEKLGIPSCLGTALILKSFYSISNKICNIIAYNRSQYSYGDRIDSDQEPVWILEDPMTQDGISGILYPLEKRDIMSIYMESPLYIPSNLPIPVDTVYPIPDRKKPSEDRKKSDVMVLNTRLTIHQVRNTAFMNQSLPNVSDSEDDDDYY